MYFIIGITCNVPENIIINCRYGEFRDTIRNLRYVSRCRFLNHFEI